MSLLMKPIDKKGEVAEWLKAHAWKACKGVILSWVRIPFSPPYLQKYKFFKIYIHIRSWVFV